MVTGKGPNPACSHFHSIWIPNNEAPQSQLGLCPQPLVINMAALFCSLSGLFAKSYPPNKDGKLLWTGLIFTFSSFCIPSWYSIHFCLIRSFGHQLERLICSLLNTILSSAFYAQYHISISVSWLLNRAVYSTVGS